MEQFKAVVRDFQQEFGASPVGVVRAPGRVNLIGEHTDYSEGFVFPFAIDRGIDIAAGPGKPGVITVRSMAMGETVSFPVDVDAPVERGAWQNYLRGVAAGLRGKGVEVRGACLNIGGTLATGGGLSSSAALCVATAKALLGVAGAELDPMEIVKLAQKAEHDFAGTPCGIMDQYVCVFGRADRALVLDCRDLTHELVPLNLSGCELLVIQSGVKHALSDGAYAKRVAECAAAVAGLKKFSPGIKTLRDVSVESLEKHGDSLEPVVFRRARHVVTENDRVQRAAAALQRSDMPELGRLLSETHASLRDDYGVSCSEIELIVKALAEHRDVLGCRMVGGGFGGAVLAIVRGGTALDVSHAAASAFADFDRSPGEMFTVSPSAGARLLTLKDGEFA